MWSPGLIKAGVFGLIVTLMGCYHGYNSGRGAQGVGTATTYAVVSASILILVFNYILTPGFLFMTTPAPTPKIELSRHSQILRNKTCPQRR